MPRYEYYLLGDVVPIRVSFNERGHRDGADVPDKELGRLKQNPTYLGRLLVSMEVEEITEPEFRQRCFDILGKNPY